MGTLIRTIICASLFLSFVLVYVPFALLMNVTRSPTEQYDIQGIIGLLAVTTGAAAGLWCILTFTFKGKGTPAPFDPPQKLVVSGPYRFVRNPMYLGAGIALLGAALFYHSWYVAGYGMFLWVISHLFVVYYEEPTLMKTFGEVYGDYKKRVVRGW